jgi:hypothetical protein
MAPTATDELFVIPTNWSSWWSYAIPDPPNVTTRFPEGGPDCGSVMVIVTPQLGTLGNAVEHMSAHAGAANSMSKVQQSTTKTTLFTDKTVAGRRCALVCGSLLSCARVRRFAVMVFPPGDFSPEIRNEIWDQARESEVDAPQQNSDSLGERNCAILPAPAAIVNEYGAFEVFLGWPSSAIFIYEVDPGSTRLQTFALARS